MQEGPPPLVVCPWCRTVLLGGRGYCPRCGFNLNIAANSSIPGYAVPHPPGQAGWGVPFDPQRTRWRRTRTGLLATAAGLILVWIPWLSVLGALLISMGSSLMFLGARAPPPPHRKAVSLAFLAFTIGAVIIVFLLAGFLVRAYQIAGRAPMTALGPNASTLQWGSLPGTAAIALGLALQVHFLVRPRERVALYLLSALLVATAFVATALADAEILALSPNVTVRTGPVLDLLSRLSMYRIVEAPAYLGLAVVYLLAHRGSMGTAAPGSPSPVPNAP